MVILSNLYLNIIYVIINFFDINDICDLIEIVFIGMWGGVLTSYIYFRFWKKWTTLGNGKENDNKKSILYFKKEEKDID
jgi:hypothetical protein